MTTTQDGPAAATRPGAPEGSGQARSRAARYGWAFGVVWLVFLYYPLHTAWAEPHQVRRMVGVAALVLFAAAFAAFFIRWRWRRMAGEPLPPATIGGVLLVGAALLALAAPAARQDVVAGFVYLAVIAMMSLPLRAALGVVGALATAVLVLPRVLPGWQTQDSFVLQLLLASFAAYGVGQVILRNGQLLRARAQLVDLAVTEERERVARDVHDILGHSLTVITVKTELAGRLLEAAGQGDSRARAELADAERLAREALADVRATVSGMREVSLTGELAAARRALAAAGIGADLPGAVDAVPARFRPLFAWAVREGITNVVRHSGARSCAIRLSADCVEIRDDGRGPSSASGPGGPSDPGGGSGGGTGLLGLRARAEAAGARLETGPAPGGGFLLRVSA